MPGTFRSRSISTWRAANLPTISFKSRICAIMPTLVSSLSFSGEFNVKNSVFRTAGCC